MFTTLFSLFTVMGLQKVFCATTIVIGLFVSVDYALCDEFHCRGYEREKVEDDGGQWSRTTHFLWGLTYIAGLGLWCFHFSVLEGQIVSMHLVSMTFFYSNLTVYYSIYHIIFHNSHSLVSGKSTSLQKAKYSS